MYGAYPSIQKKQARVSALLITLLVVFSYHFGSCSTGGSAHLLWHGDLWWDWEGWKGDIAESPMEMSFVCVSDDAFWTCRMLFKHIMFVKVTMEAQLGLIGGTMGLLTGFSILSAVEIVYFLLRLLRIFFDKIWICQLDKFLLRRFFMSLRIGRTEVVSAVRKRFENHLTRKD